MSLEDVLSEISIKRILQQRHKTRKVISKIAGDLRSLGTIKNITPIRSQCDVVGMSERHSYLSAGYWSQFLLLIGGTKHFLSQVNGQEPELVDQFKKMKLFELDPYQLYLRGGWIASKELMEEAHSSSTDLNNIILLDQSLIFSRRRMPLTSDREVVVFFHEIMSPLEKLWKEIQREGGPVIIGVDEYTSSKLTNAIIDRSSHLHFEAISEDLIGYVASLKEEHPWLSEGVLLQWLLKPGERTVAYLLSSENLQGKPDALLREGIVTTYVKSGGGRLFRIEIPYFYLDKGLEDMERFISTVFSFCSGFQDDLPRPILESRSLLKTVNMRETLKGLSRVINSLER